MGPKVRTADEEIAGIAGRAHGVVTRAELLRAGLTEKQIKRRVARGALIRVHRGVYRVGHAAPSLLALYLAAVRACGDRAVLSGPAAAHLWGIVRGKPPGPEVTSPRDHQVRESAAGGPAPSHPGTRPPTGHPRHVSAAHHRRHLPSPTCPCPRPRPARGRDQAPAHPWDVEAVLSRRPNSPGAAKLRAVLHGREPVTLSTLESAFLSLLRAGDLPLPHTNTRFGSRRLDGRWPAQRLVVDLDSYRYHGSRHAWEEDRRRERLVRAAGDEFRRYTWGDVLETPALMLAELRTLLS